MQARTNPYFNAAQARKRGKTEEYPFKLAEKKKNSAIANPQSSFPIPSMNEERIGTEIFVRTLESTVTKYFSVAAFRRKQNSHLKGEEEKRSHLAGEEDLSDKFSTSIESLLESYYEFETPIDRTSLPSKQNILPKDLGIRDERVARTFSQNKIRERVIETRETKRNKSIKDNEDHTSKILSKITSNFSSSTSNKETKTKNGLNDVGEGKYSQSLKNLANYSDSSEDENETNKKKSANQEETCMENRGHQRDISNLQNTLDEIQNVDTSHNEESKTKSTSTSTGSKVIPLRNGKMTGKQIIREKKTRNNKRKRVNNTDEEAHSIHNEVEQNPSSSVMSMKSYCTNRTFKKRLKEIEDDRKMGTLVQCCTCGKWRYLKDIIDPCLIPETWNCEDNPDVEQNSCSIFSAHLGSSDDEWIDVNFTVGSLVWARITSELEWWPCMIDDDPDTNTFCWIDSDPETVSWYHVLFFNRLKRMIARSWIKVENVVSFTNHETYLDKSNELQMAAYLEASRAQSMSIADRRKYYGFLSRYKGSWRVLPWVNKRKNVTKRDFLIKKNEKRQKKVTSNLDFPTTKKKKRKNSADDPVEKTKRSQNRKKGAKLNKGRYSQKVSSMNVEETNKNDSEADTLEFDLDETRLSFSLLSNPWAPTSPAPTLSQVEEDVIKLLDGKSDVFMAEE